MHLYLYEHTRPPRQIDAPTALHRHTAMHRGQSARVRTRCSLTPGSRVVQGILQVREDVQQLTWLGLGLGLG